MRKFGPVLAAISAAFLLAGVCTAGANADDEAWIRRCVSDNRDEGQSPETLSTYCACMNGKMSSKETLSITAWEKKNPDQQEACSKKAGWRS